MTALATRDASRIYNRQIEDSDNLLTPTVHYDDAVRLLEARGYTNRGQNGWDSPDGVHYWHTSEALAIALVAEAHAA